MSIQEFAKKTNYRAQLDAYLDTFFEENISKATAIHSRYKKLWEVIYTLAQSGGKRLRPELTLLTYEAFGGPDLQSILPIAAAYELLHLSLLIHDDIIDRDYMRHGIENVAGTYKKLYASSLQDMDDLAHYSESTSLLAGDLLISASYQLITNAHVIPQKLIAIQNLLGESIFDVAGGELLDTESSFMKSAVGAKKIARYKTASYTFIAPILSGALLASVSIEKQKLLREFATHLGIAYQLADDVISIFGDEKKTGKSTTSDIREGKQTFLIEAFNTHASTQDIALFRQYFGKHNITQHEANLVRDLLTRSGAKKETEDAIRTHATSAKKILLSLELDNEYYKRFSNIVLIATKRDH